MCGAVKAKGDAQEQYRDSWQADVQVYARGTESGSASKLGRGGMEAEPALLRDICFACDRLIRTFTPAMEGVEFGSASKVGRGGMEAKVASAWDAAQAGVVTVIANGKKSDVLLKACARQPRTAWQPLAADVCALS